MIAFIILFSHFVLFYFWFCRIFLYRCRRCWRLLLLFLACYLNFIMLFLLLLESLHQLTALWWSFMNNAINCDFKKKSNKRNNTAAAAKGGLGCNCTVQSKSMYARTRSFAFYNEIIFVVHFHMTLSRDPLICVCVFVRIFQCIVHIKIKYSLKKKSDVILLEKYNHFYFRHHQKSHTCKHTTF